MALALPLSAENPDSLAASLPTIADHISLSGNSTVSQPEKLNDRLRPVASPAAADDSAEPAAARRTTGGYRIQAFSGNNARTSSGEARSRAGKISAAFPEHAVYVTYDAPYWRLRVGDFQSYEDASAALSVIKAQFPEFARELRLVRSKINFSE